MNGKDRQRAIRELRGYMWSPGRPSTARREDRVRFWEAIARACRRRTRRPWRGWHPRLGPGGSVTLAARLLSRCSRPRTGSCRLRSGRRSRSWLSRSSVSARSLGGSTGRRRRSRESCAVTRRPGLMERRIGRRPRSGTPRGGGAGRRCPSLPPMTGCASTYRTVLLARSPGPMASLWLTLLCVSLGDVTADELTGDGPGRGAPSRSRTGSASTSPMMGPCGSRMRRSIRRCTCRAVCSASRADRVFAHRPSVASSKSAPARRRQESPSPPTS